MECPACHHDGMSCFFEIDRVPVFCNVLWPSLGQALAAPRGGIRLAFCTECGLIYNVAFDPSLTVYAPAYENSLHFSARFQEYAENLSRRLVERYHLYGKDIVEIGCGRGDFLATLCRTGNNRGVGFDPAYDGDGAGKAPNHPVTILPETFSAVHARYPADLICCRHVLEHVARPLEFLLEVRHAIGDRRNAAVYFEVPNTLYTLKDMGVWDIIYEHCSYFTPSSLARLFRRARFGHVEVAVEYEGQFLSVQGHPVAGDAPTTRQQESAEDDVPALTRKFHAAHAEKLAEWRDRMLGLQQDGARTVLWGGGSKGVTFLNVLNVSDQVIRYVADINPRKRGRFVPGTGQRVVAPRFLRRYRPDVIIVMNPVYLQEIRRMLQELGVCAELLVA